MRASMRSLVLLVAVALAGCGDDPSCAALATHIEELARREAPGGAVKVADHGVMVRNCEAERAGNARFRRCVMKATSLADAKGCELAAIRR